MSFYGMGFLYITSFALSLACPRPSLLVAFAPHVLSPSLREESGAVGTRVSSSASESM